MTLVTEEELAQRVQTKENVTFNPILQQENANSKRSKLPVKLKYNGFNGGERAETYMASRATLR